MFENIKLVKIKQDIIDQLNDHFSTGGYTFDLNTFVGRMIINVNDNNRFLVQCELSYVNKEKLLVIHGTFAEVENKISKQELLRVCMSHFTRCIEEASSLEDYLAFTVHTTDVDKFGTDDTKTVIENIDKFWELIN